MAAGETIYAPGADADTFYIINRGIVEIEAKGVAPSYLARGDVFGDLEVLNHIPRKHLARAHEPVSLQSFEKRDFPELLTRAPSFFFYLTEQLARRLVQASDAAAANTGELQLSGSLVNFDLVTIYQTIVNSSQTGELAIRTEEDELVCTFFFAAGQPRCGQFQHLTGEEAFWQLFLAETPRGSFAFSAGDKGVSHSTRGGTISRQPGDMLISALQSRDEFHALKHEIHPRALLERRKSYLTVQEAGPEELFPAIEQVWHFLLKGPATVGSLYPHLSFNELAIYQAARGLLRSGHLEAVPAEQRKLVA
ncbi:MAG: cyclic nucleotide-binding domain-containing protein [Chthoniobacterales bacterium]|nr:cyclic nucleotide-binding domain-containing protein [Chthoniobacterales bacterium]